jgi:hypothetical protein
MKQLWDAVLSEVWNMKRSLERDRRDPTKVRNVLIKRFDERIVKAIMKPKASPESSIAAVYAAQARPSINVGRARNSLRAYQKETGAKFVAQV